MMKEALIAITAIIVIVVIYHVCFYDEGFSTSDASRIGNLWRKQANDMSKQLPKPTEPRSL